MATINGTINTQNTQNTQDNTKKITLMTVTHVVLAIATIVSICLATDLSTGVKLIITGLTLGRMMLLTIYEVLGNTFDSEGVLVIDAITTVLLVPIFIGTLMIASAGWAFVLSLLYGAIYFASSACMIMDM